MGYSESPEMVRVDIFKPSGKWYTTLAIEWKEYDGSVLIQNAFRDAIEGSDAVKFRGFTAVCLEPYHEHQHPLMIIV